MQAQSPHCRVVNSQPSNAPAMIWALWGQAAWKGLHLQCAASCKKKHKTKQTKLAFFGLTLYISYVIITNLFHA